MITFLGKGLLLGISGPEQLYDFQKFLAARNPREASKIGFPVRLSKSAIRMDSGDQPTMVHWPRSTASIMRCSRIL